MKNPCVLLLTLLFSVIPGGYSYFWFETTIDNVTGEFIAEEGESVDLNCEPCHKIAIGVGIYRVHARPYGLTVYSLSVRNVYYTTQIDRLTVDHSGRYLCKYYVLECFGPWWHQRCEWMNVKYSIKLYVIPSMPEVGKTCVLFENTYDIFFVGDDIVLRCTGIQPNELEISISDGTSDYEEYNNLPSLEDAETGTVLLTIPGINRTFNEATISCEGRDQDGEEIDLCRNVTTISVFAELEITVSPTDLRVPNQGNATLFCQSELFFLASFNWEIIDDGVAFWNTSMVPVDGGMILDVLGIDFTNSTSKTFNVSCNVTVGTRSAVKTATVSEEEIMVGFGNRSEEVPRSSPVVAIIVVPVIVGVALVCVIVASLVWYCRPSSKETERTAKIVDGKKDGTHTKSEPRNVYSYDRASENTRLGYSSPDAKVADNVSYVPYGIEKP